MAKLPAQIDKYELVRRLGYGGMGTVYLGRDPDLDRMVAIKVLRDPLFDEELLQRFLREARAAANLRHENIITVYDVGQHDHQPFMAMEYVEGLSLGELIRAQQPLTLSDKLSYIEQICSGLAFAHAKGIVHRDIKPANLMIDRRNMIRILDFGIARVEGSGMTSDGALIGTLNYMSPEQMLGRAIDLRSDIFAVGAVAYELLAYQQAFPGSMNDGLLQRLPQEDPKSLAELCPGLPDGLETIVMRALAKSPADRYADLEQTRAAIRDIRRHIDPDLQLDPIIVQAAATLLVRPTVPVESSAERKELLERRARQIAAHRDAAREALARQDITGAAAACEDALTLDPDDSEALRIQVEIQHTKQRFEQESKARHERERTQRQRLADAELKLSRGDVAGAGALVHQMLVEDPADAAAHTMASRVKASGAATGVVLPDFPAAPEFTMVAGRPDTRGAGPHTAGASATLGAATAVPQTVVPVPLAQPTAGRGKMVAIGLGVAAALIGAAVVLIPRDRPAETPVTPISATTTPAASPATANAPAAAPAVAGSTTAATPVTTPPPTVRDTPTVETAPVDRALADQIARVNTAYTNGDLATALRLIEPVLAKSDTDDTRSLAQRIADRGRESMNDAERAATAQKAPQLSRDTYTAAAQSKSRSDQAFGRRDYVQAGRQALAAADGYRRATQEATVAASHTAAPSVVTPTPTPPAAAPVSAPATTPAIASTTPAPTGAPAPTSAPVAATPAPAAVIPAPTPARTDPAILRALGRYQDAYRKLDVKALRDVYPKLPRETGQRLERQFKNCRAYEVTFLSPQVSPVVGDPTAANVNLRATYACQPKSAQAEQSSTMQEMFAVRKFGDEWVIENIFSSN